MSAVLCRAHTARCVSHAPVTPARSTPSTLTCCPRLWCSRTRVTPPHNTVNDTVCPRLRRPVVRTCAAMTRRRCAAFRWAQTLFATMVEDVRDTRSPREDADDIPRPAKGHGVSLRQQVMRIMLARKYNDTSMYHHHPSYLRPAVCSVHVSQLLHALHCRLDGGAFMSTINTQQHIMKNVHDDAMRVRRPLSVCPSSVPLSALCVCVPVFCAASVSLMLSPPLLAASIVGARASVSASASASASACVRVCACNPSSFPTMSFSAHQHCCCR